ncbi:MULTISPECIES: glycosyltransferase [unclassified Microbacterium]|uniref:glycosyltransferase n=1 Tax=unclassified Microbacterium TaxID=2609290 RepID=UPI00214AB322|nr:MULTISPECIES: glycosyltransferase [unclassified Microbacterium]MCR2810248.1 glycosyltransferase [Microbacterium sp. zg.B185]WIM19923.1 glycosyltransferase [Microbacterium sp. zg-B185]
MSEPVFVSVCMATYNGSAYVEHQLRSILAELLAGDEVVVVDDASTDDTVAVVEAVGDARVRVIRQPANRGYVRTFETALLAAQGEVILLADQDDEWVAGRRTMLVSAAQAAGVAASNLELLGTGEPLRSPLSGRPWLLREATSRQRVRNELRILAGVAPYFGCAMAVRRDMLAAITPFPAFLTESHDLWIATVANATGHLRHVEPATVRRRVHAANASSPRPRGVRRALGSRWMLVRAWREALRRRRTLG